MEAFAWIALRAVYAWMFLYPVFGLIRDWPDTVKTTALVFKQATSLFAFASLVVMILGSLMILFGVYGQYAAVALVAFNLGGTLVHYRLAGLARQSHLSAGASAEDRATLANVAKLGWLGNVTSAEKNFVLAAVALFFALVGTGPFSVVPSTGILPL